MKRVLGRKGKALPDEAELRESLLPNSGQAQNVASKANFVFGNKTSDDEGESLEMSEFGSARSKAQRRRTDIGADKNAEISFVYHQLEPHHTLAGVALQYRVTVEQLMRLNQLQTQQDLYSREKLRIPTHKYGTLYNNPEQYRSQDAGTTTHTTALPQRATSVEDVRKEAFLIDVPENAPLQEESGRRSRTEFLESFDNQMRTAIAAIDETLLKQSESNRDDIIAVRTARDKDEWVFKLQDWRVAVVALSVILLVSFSTVYLLRYVSAPEPVSKP
eukprot:m.276867 g.276867  ORF g.276867 m.276867 type:complete len:275 (+) comp19772_c0_seq1:328-1152(+)